MYPSQEKRKVRSADYMSWDRMAFTHCGTSVKGADLGIGNKLVKCTWYFRTPWLVDTRPTPRVNSSKSQLMVMTMGLHGSLVVTNVPAIALGISREVWGGYDT